MAGWDSCSLLLFVSLCCVASVCEAGYRGGYRYRYRYSGGSSSSGSSDVDIFDEDVWKIIGIIIGAIGGLIFLLACCCYCIGSCCGTSDDDANANANGGNSGDMELTNHDASSANADTNSSDPQTSTTTTNPNPHDNPSFSPPCTLNGMPDRVPPPSYNSVFSQGGEGPLPYPSSPPNGDAPYPSHPSYIAHPSGVAYPPDPSRFVYSAHPNVAPSAPSYRGAYTGPSPDEDPDATRFERPNMQWQKMF